MFDFIRSLDMNVVTLVSGALSMIGGALGAFGAYLVARHQINNEKIEFKARSVKLARPTIICLEFIGEASLERTKMHTEARLLETDFYKRIQDKSKFIKFVVIKHTGIKSHILACEIEIYMDPEIHRKTDSIIKSFMGAVERDTEIFIPVPSVFDGENIRSRTNQVKITFETMENENIEYIYDIRSGVEQYYLITNRKRKLLKEINLSAGVWLMPGKQYDK
ncbi:hypothetical protein ABIA69_004534 [Lysinibacillus parviboronicapiens]|uniref:Uncharacterized protein n=1 Tax=Lysinibacillus parviboronicapiens TaxID=436516 RepID=A0ABV2PQV6_9BACI